jgi:uncharacterized membrane protein
MKTMTVALYWLLGILSLLAGVAVLIMPSLIVPPEESSGLIRHLLREEAALFVFVGLMFFWLVTHYEQRRPVHLAMLVFITLFAGVHWVDYLDHGTDWASALVNTIPVALLAITAPLGRP